MAQRLKGRGWIGMLFVAATLGACSPAASAGPESPPPVVAAPSAPVAAAPVRPEPIWGAPAKGFPVRAVLAPTGPLEAGDYVWEPEGVPEGPLRIVVDIEAREIHVYRAGYEIGRAHIIYGDDDKPTPLGTFPILEKRERHVSNLYGAPMPYMMRLTWDGIAIHSSTVDDGFATHGCVGVPDEFAALLFAEARRGDLVMVTNGWMKRAPEGQAGAAEASIPAPEPATPRAI